MSAPRPNKRIVLAGNPNVGKSVIFSRLTGVQVIASNYPGTTVGFTRGYLTFPSDLEVRPGAPFAPAERVEIVDAPGVYSLCPCCPADQVARDLIAGADYVVCVVDSTNLERNLNLVLQILETGIPAVVALNMWDETAHRGVKIDPALLERRLHVPVVPVVGVTGEGIRKLVERLDEAVSSGLPSLPGPERWRRIGEIVGECQELVHHHHTFLQLLSDLSVKPWTGLPLAAGVIFFAFVLVRLIGEFLVAGDVVIFREPLLKLPFGTTFLFETAWVPLMEKLSILLGGGGFLHDLLIGALADGKIDLMQSFGLLTTGLYIPLGVVLPYILAFYLVLGFLEDFGYLPRLAVLLDWLMHRLGLHGYAIIPNLLALGCNVPAILATRVLESRRERFIAATLVSIAIPCAALQAMVIGVLGPRGGRYVLLVYLVLFCVWLVTGFILSRTVKGYSPELIIEIPHYRLPPFGPYWKKIFSRLRGFLKEGIPVILLGVAAVNILDYLGFFSAVSVLAAPVVEKALGLPREVSTVLVVGFLRKDMALGLLAPMGLTTKELVVACSVLAMFFPCLATFAVLLRELGWRDLLKATGVMLVVSLTAGTALNFLLRL